MTATGGRTPWDQSQAATGPARVVYTDDTDVDVPTSLWDIVAPVNTAGEYPLSAGWKDFGLAADAPTYTHAKDTSGLEYQQPSQELFEQVSSITRTFVAQVGEISPENMAVVENIATSAISTIAAAAHKSGQKKLPFGLYSGLLRRRIALISYRPEGAGVVVESDGTRRPPAVALILPQVALSTEDSEFGFEKGTPTNGSISFTCFPDPDLDAGEEHGFWIFEIPGTIASS